MAKSFPLRKNILAILVLVLLLEAQTTAGENQPAEKIPVLYATDLFQPHDDPDDHYDLATLFALEEFDIRGIILEQGEKQQKRPGRIPVEQMLSLSGRKVPWGAGLNRPLKSVTDDGRQQPEPCQQGVQLLLDVLRKSERKVTIMTTGSMRDVAAAFNREPDLLRQKVHRLYMNIGHAKATKSEFNVDLDRLAYVRILQSGLPIYWCPCFGQPYGTYWKFRQAEVLKASPPQLHNFFIYALTTGTGYKGAKPAGTEDPIAFLRGPLDAAVADGIGQKHREMWSTASFLHAAGRRIIEIEPGRWLAAPSAQAKHQNQFFSFVPTWVALDAATGITAVDEKEDRTKLKITTFKVLEPGRYQDVMTSCLRELYRQMPLGKARPEAERQR